MMKILTCLVLSLPLNVGHALGGVVFQKVGTDHLALAATSHDRVSKEDGNPRTTAAYKVVFAVPGKYHLYGRITSAGGSMWVSENFGEPAGKVITLPSKDPWQDFGVSYTVDDAKVGQELLFHISHEGAAPPLDRLVFHMGGDAHTLASLPDSPIDSVIEPRLRAALQHALVKPWPNPDLNHGERFSLYSLLLGRNIERANRYIENAPLPVAFSHPYGDHSPNDFLEMYLTPLCHRLMTDAAKRRVEEMAWHWVNTRSALDPNGGWPYYNPNKHVWYIIGSDNHDPRVRTASMMAVQVLRKAGAPYGPDAVLADGHKVEAHYQAWVKWFTEYFRQRARHGLQCEIASPTSYGAATTHHWSSIYDTAESPELREVAGNFLTLYWANVAVEYDPRSNMHAAFASTRGGKTRLNHGWWGAPVAYAYGWCDEPALPNLAWTSITSSWRPPAILTAIARDKNRPPFLSHSRRFGRTNGKWHHGVYEVLFDDGDARNSSVRRDVYRTPEYTMSSISFDPRKSYIALLGHGRRMGVAFATGSRVTAAASKLGQETIDDWVGINGLTRTNCMIVARDTGVQESSDSTCIALSSGRLWDGRIENDGGWLFTRDGDGYCAIRIANGSYQVTPVTNRNQPIGHGLELEDIWSPVVIQMGRAGDYESFDAFRASVKANRFDYREGLLTYESEAGDLFEYRSRSEEIPKINGVIADLNPPKACDSPYLSMEHNSSKAVISYPNHEKVVLDFGWKE